MYNFLFVLFCCSNFVGIYLFFEGRLCMIYRGLSEKGVFFFLKGCVGK